MSILLLNRRQRFLQFLRYIYLSKSLILSYLNVKNLTDGRRLYLYFSPLMRHFQTYFPSLFKIFLLVFRLSSLSSNLAFNLLQIRFWLLVFYHFLEVYKTVFALRICFEYLHINQYESNKFIQTLYDFAEPGIKLIENFLPRGFLRSLLVFYCCEIIYLLIKYMNRILTTYAFRFSTVSIDPYGFITVGLIMPRVDTILRFLLEEEVMFN